jgi:hypothetical protein
MQHNGVLTHEHAWTLFEPNTLGYSKQDSQDRALLIKNCSYFKDPTDGAEKLLVRLNFVDFDGHRFGMNRLFVTIPPFEGTMPITSLAVYPMKYHKDADDLQASLIARGGRVEDLAGSHFRQYNGVGWTYDSQGKKAQVTVRGRVIIDAGGYNKYNHKTIRHFPIHSRTSQSTLPKRPSAEPELLR